MPRSSDPIYLIDASVYIFRAFFSLPDSIKDSSGRSANVIYGFTDFLMRFRKVSGANRAALCFDESLTTSFRNEIDPAYKANRPEAPEDLKRQIHACKEVGKLMGFPVYASPRYEADDLIGSLAQQLRSREKGSRVCIVSTDKDLLQVLKTGDEFWNFSKDERFSGKLVPEKFGVEAHQVADLLAITGDAVDNIQGLPGIGKTTAIALLKEFKTLDGLLQNLNRLKSHKMRGAARFYDIISQNLDVLEKSRQLTLIESSLTVEKNLKQLTLRPPDLAGLEKFFQDLGIGQRLLARLSEDISPKSSKKSSKKASKKASKARR